VEPVSSKPNRAARRQTLKTVQKVKTAAQDKVHVRRASQLAQQISPLNPSTAGFASSAAEPPDENVADMQDWLRQRPPRTPDVPPADFDGEPRQMSVKLVRGDEALVQGLVDIIGAVTIPLMFLEPYDGAVLAQNAEQTAVALVRISHRHPRMRKALKRIADGYDYVFLGMAVGGQIVGIAQHHGLVSPLFMAPFKSTWLPEKDPAWLDQNGSSSPSPSTSAGGSAGSPSASERTSRPAYTGPSSQPSSRDMQTLLQQAQALTPGLHNLAAATASYNPDDTVLRPEQDPTFLPELARRDR
jgi:hypothetical protein